jgi:NADPH:quinone reductase-like Zn-dependent oxidoreductase
MRSFAAGEVVRSRNADYAPGDRVTGMFGWQEYAIADARAISRTVPRDDIPLSAALGVLGLNGLTAYFALLDVGAPKSGDTVLVSTTNGKSTAASAALSKSRNVVCHKATGATIAELRRELQKAANENGRLISRLAEASSAAASSAEQIEAINEVVQTTSARLELLDRQLQVTLEELNLLNDASQAG